MKASLPCALFIDEDLSSSVLSTVKLLITHMLLYRKYMINIPKAMYELSMGFLHRYMTPMAVENAEPKAEWFSAAHAC